MKIFKFLLILLMISGIAPLWSAPPSKTIVTRIMDPKDYAVRRFQEVLEEAGSESDLSPQEQLIAARARLALSERKLEEMKSNKAASKSEHSTETNPTVKRDNKKAALARIDFYQKQVGTLEAQILTDKRKSREVKRPIKKTAKRKN